MLRNDCFDYSHSNCNDSGKNVVGSICDESKKIIDSPCDENDLFFVNNTNVISGNYESNEIIDRNIGSHSEVNNISNSIDSVCSQIDKLSLTDSFDFLRHNKDIPYFIKGRMTGFSIEEMFHILYKPNVSQLCSRLPS